LLEDLFDALELEHVDVVGHSLGGMFALWHAARGSRRIERLVAIGDPAVALPGTRVRMPLSPLTVRGLGPAVLRSPAPRFVHRRLLAQGFGRAEVAATPGALLEALRLSSRRAENARTVGSLMRAIDGFRRPRLESVLSNTELAGIRTPTMFIWGTDDPYLSPQSARPSIERMPSATLHQVAAGHGPWLVEPERTARSIRRHVGSLARACDPSRT
jgi:pimeloyl-ACP methyl ester carboxylesterase